MADDERRAEIEAVRELLRAWDARELSHPEHPATHRDWAAWMNEAADRLRSDLDRVRDARGDDRAAKNLRRKGFHEAAAEVEDRKRTFFAPHSGHDVEAARSPQGGDHEAGRQAAAVALAERWPRLGIVARVVVYRHPTHRQIADVALDAFLSRAPSSVSGTEPDTCPHNDDDCAMGTCKFCGPEGAYGKRTRSGTEPDTAKLVRYAVHKPDCRLRRAVEHDLTPRGKCTCGLDAALAGFSVDAEKRQEESK